MKHGHRRHRRDALAAQLRQLLPIRRIHVHKAIHVADDKALDVVARGALPLRAEDRHPPACLVVVFDDGRGGELGVREGGAGGKRGRRGQRVDFDRVVVGGGGDLAGGVERGVGDGEAGFVLGDEVGEAPGGGCGAADFAHVPDFQEAVERGGCEEVGRAWVQGEAADFFLRQRPGFDGVVGWGAGVEAADVPV